MSSRAVVVGAGLSGIGTAAQLTAEFPHKTLAVLERRERLGAGGLGRVAVPERLLVELDELPCFAVRQLVEDIVAFGDRSDEKRRVARQTFRDL